MHSIVEVQSKRDTDGADLDAECIEFFEKAISNEMKLNKLIYLIYADFQEVSFTIRFLLRWV